MGMAQPTCQEERCIARRPLHDIDWTTVPINVRDKRLDVARSSCMEHLLVVSCVPFSGVSDAAIASDRCERIIEIRRRRQPRYWRRDALPWIAAHPTTLRHNPFRCAIPTVPSLVLLHQRLQSHNPPSRLMDRIGRKVERPLMRHDGEAEGRIGEPATTTTTTSVTTAKMLMPDLIRPKGRGGMTRRDVEDVPQMDEPLTTTSIASVGICRGSGVHIVTTARVEPFEAQRHGCQVQLVRGVAVAVAVVLVAVCNARLSSRGGDAYLDAVVLVGVPPPYPTSAVPSAVGAVDLAPPPMLLLDRWRGSEGVAAVVVLAAIVIVIVIVISTTVVAIIIANPTQPQVSAPRHPDGVEGYLGERATVPQQAGYYQWTMTFLRRRRCCCC